MAKEKSKENSSPENTSTAKADDATTGLEEKTTASEQETGVDKALKDTKAELTKQQEENKLLNSNVQNLQSQMAELQEQLNGKKQADAAEELADIDLQSDPKQFLEKLTKNITDGILNNQDIQSVKNGVQMINRHSVIENVKNKAGNEDFEELRSELNKQLGSINSSLDTFTGNAEVLQYFVNNARNAVKVAKFEAGEAGKAEVEKKKEQMNAADIGGSDSEAFKDDGSMVDTPLGKMDSFSATLIRKNRFETAQ